MHLLQILTAVLATPGATFGAPVEPGTADVAVLTARQARKQPPPCTRQNPAPSEESLKARFDTFVQAFVGPAGRKNITEAFEYIVEDYINHNPIAQNGAKSAWDILSGIWHNFDHRLLRSTISGDTSWVEYNSGSVIVDRFRWEGGCIVEHWDVGEKYPVN
ncbi:hypothetical protein QBC47DRAFT_420781 [Echria macrotheca]|uniref:SnoaL-like domain-containing protein n=1 Tax=Echria macrotheca TaxID=438768 RepID=A0AAJ0BNA6_9PEZI|nr:hypothetical protein QBC47DRAFT_420781 [Echria macrotheca]